MIDFKQLNDSLQALSVLSALNLKASTVFGGYWRGQCPFHESKSYRPRTLAVSLERRQWICHKCGSFGDLIDLWAGVRGISLVDAAQELTTEFAGKNRNGKRNG